MIAHEAAAEREQERSVGVLVSAKPGGVPRGRTAMIYREMITAAAAADIAMFYFSAAGAEDLTRPLAGFSLRRGRWESGEFSCPPVVYNRIVDRRLEARPAVARLLAQLHEWPSVHCFNSRFLDKWEVEQALDAEPALAPLRLESALLTADALRRFAARYPEFFIKLRSGNTARGLCKVARGEGGGFRYARFRADSVPRWRRAATVEALAGALLRAYPAGSAFLQEGMKLARWQERIFDLRVLVQKDGAGQWQPSARAVRIAGTPRDFVTHIPNGGQAGGFAAMLTPYLGRRRYEAMTDSLEALSVLAAQTLERESCLQLGVLSLDAGMDERGGLKLFEINSKPAGFDEPELREQHLQLLTQYFNYLLNQGQR